MTELKIRAARAGDEGEIARVHIQSWQEAYQNIVPQSYLDQLPTELESRVANWSKILANPQRWTWVAETSLGIIGFAVFGRPRDQGRDGFIELGAIYLLALHKGRGVGFSLLSTGFRNMKVLGYSRAYCWVLEKNPTVQFYEGTGARFAGPKKQEEVGGEVHSELMYEWRDLDLNTHGASLFITTARDDRRAIEKFYVSCERNTRLNDEDTIVGAKNGGKISGVVRLCEENGNYVLRTMQIRPDFQRRGLGSTILQHFDRLLRERGIDEIFCMPYAHLENFYRQIGFEQIARDAAPTFLQERAAKFTADHPDEKVILMKRSGQKIRTPVNAETMKNGLTAIR